MTINEIKQAVNDGKAVYWLTDAYKVIKDNMGMWLIQCTLNDSCVGLTNLGGDKLNGKETDFYIEPFTHPKIKLVVIDEQILGYIRPELPERGQVLHGSILKGYVGNGWDPIVLPGKTVRLATKQDFEEYRCAWSEAYETDEYEYAQDGPAT